MDRDSILGCLVLTNINIFNGFTKMIQRIKHCISDITTAFYLLLMQFLQCFCLFILWFVVCFVFFDVVVVLCLFLKISVSNIHKPNYIRLVFLSYGCIYPFSTHFIPLILNCDVAFVPSYILYIYLSLNVPNMYVCPKHGFV